MKTLELSLAALPNISHTRHFMFFSHNFPIWNSQHYCLIKTVIVNRWTKNYFLAQEQEQIYVRSLYNDHIALKHKNVKTTSVNDLNLVNVQL